MDAMGWSRRLPARQPRTGSGPEMANANNRRDKNIHLNHGCVKSGGVVENDFLGKEGRHWSSAGPRASGPAGPRAMPARPASPRAARPRSAHPRRAIPGARARLRRAAAVA
eukprot:5402134-Prymnesium_polylepis.1